MKTESSPCPAPAPRWALPLITLLAALLVAGLHLASGSAGSELGSHPDEAAHFVTGLMVRDYIAGGLHGSPMAFADRYYRHYPKIGLGIWPPFFYLVQAAWELALPAGAPSILWLMAAITVALAVLLGRALLREYGVAAALAGPALLVCLPLVQQYSNMVMAEMLSALLMFAAALALARFLENGGTREAAMFGVCAGLAIMTKGTGLALVPAAGLAILFTGRWGVLRNPRLWLAAGLVAAIAGPWTWHFRNQGRGGWEEPSPSLHFAEAAIGFYGRQMLVAVGWILAPLVAAGVWRLRKSATSATATALVLGIWLFQTIMPVGLEARHLVPAMPALIFLAMAGLDAIVPAARRAWACAGLVAIFFTLALVWHPVSHEPGYGSLGNEVAGSPFRIPRKQWGGFGPVADAILAAGKTHAMVASDARGEGMFVAEMAVRDHHRPTYTVERASKVLAASTWSGGSYQSFYTDPDQVAAAVLKTGAEAVVSDASLPRPTEHEKVLAAALAEGHGFQPARKLPITREGRVTAEGALLYWAGR